MGAAPPDDLGQECNAGAAITQIMQRESQVAGAGQRVGVVLAQDPAAGVLGALAQVPGPGEVAHRRVSARLQALVRVKGWSSPRTRRLVSWVRCCRSRALARSPSACSVPPR